MMILKKDSLTSQKHLELLLGKRSPTPRQTRMKQQLIKKQEKHKKMIESPFFHSTVLVQNVERGDLQQPHDDAGGDWTP